MNGLLFFHQGWTDIVNCLPMINIYSKKYRLLFVLVRADAAPLVSFYVRELPNVVPVFIAKQNLDSNPMHYIYNQVPNLGGFELIGHYDCLHSPNHPNKDAYFKLNRANPVFTFERLFYESYKIPYIDRVNQFSLTRDPDAEAKMYEKLVRKEPYICTHTNANLKLYVNPTEDCERIELDQTTMVFFDMIRVLQNAKAIHVIDSVWAGICYMIDARYGLLENVPVYVYCHRDYHRMFTEPVHRPNWTIINT